MLFGLLLAPNGLSGEQGSGDANFRLRMRTVDSLFARARQARKQRRIGLETYEGFIRLLREEERVIADEAKAHKFEDRTESNYWWRGRFKMPSSLQAEERLLTEGKDPANDPQ